MDAHIMATVPIRMLIFRQYTQRIRLRQIGDNPEGSGGHLRRNRT